MNAAEILPERLPRDFGKSTRQFDAWMVKDRRKPRPGRKPKLLM